jgi:hypothetical protein
MKIGVKYSGVSLNAYENGQCLGYDCTTLPLGNISTRCESGSFKIDTAKEGRESCRTLIRE